MLADKLITGVKRRITMPANQNLWENEDILEAANDSIALEIVPLLMSLRKEFFVESHTEPLIEGQKFYAIPYRAIGRTLRDLKIIDANDNISNMVMIPHEQADNTSYGCSLRAFYFMGDDIVLLSEPESADETRSLIMTYFLSPGKLVESTKAAKIESISSDTVTVESMPSDFEIGSYVDFIKGKQGYKTVLMDKVITSLSGNDIIFDSGVVPSDITTGDYISLAEYSPVIQLPDICYKYLETLTCITVLKSLSDYEAANQLLEDKKQEEKNLIKVMSPRIQGEQTKIVNRNGLLKRGGSYNTRIFE